MSNIKLMDENNNPQNIASIFNDHFSTLGAKVQSKIPPEEGNYKTYMNKREKNNDGTEGKRLINPNGCSFFLTASFSVLAAWCSSIATRYSLPLLKFACCCPLIITRYSQISVARCISLLFSPVAAPC